MEKNADVLEAVESAIFIYVIDTFCPKVCLSMLLINSVLKYVYLCYRCILSLGMFIYVIDIFCS